jgi:hypothetical protein
VDGRDEELAPRATGIDEDRLVTVARFLEPVKVQMAKGLLESLGIECFVQGENANAMLALAFRARLKVRAEDEAAAREVLSGAGEDLFEERDDNGE